MNVRMEALLLFNQALHTGAHGLRIDLQAQPRPLQSAGPNLKIPRIRNDYGSVQGTINAFLTEILRKHTKAQRTRYQIQIQKHQIHPTYGGIHIH